MPRVKKVVIDEQVEQVEEKSTMPAKDTVVVVYRNNTREYSRAIHGAGFMDLARSFAEKVGGTIV